MKKLTAALVMGASLVLVAACEDQKPPPPPAAKPKPKPVEVAAATPDGGTAEAAAPYVYAYNPVAKRDPFRVLFEGLPNDSKEGVDRPTCSEPLCQYDLDQLTLVAVISGDANPVAMLEDQGQVGHIVRRNTKVGKQGGKVTQILRDCIVVTEYFTTPDGKLNPNRVNICVKQEKSQEQVMDLLNNKQVE